MGTYSPHSENAKSDYRRYCAGCHGDLGRFATFERNMFCALEECLEEMEQRFREVSTESVASRVSSELIRLSKHLTCDANGHFEIRLSRMELGQLTGTTLHRKPPSAAGRHQESSGSVGAR
jgi:hypothetical protein